MSSLESVLEEARKLPPEERRRLVVRLLEESHTLAAAQHDEKLGGVNSA